MIKFTHMKGFPWLLCAMVAAALCSVSCKKDKTSGSLWFERPALYMTEGQAAEVRFAGSEVDLASAWVSSSPSGWTVKVDHAARTLSVTAPAADADDAAASGSVTLRANSTGGGTAASAVLFVGLTRTVDLSDSPANCYLVREKEVNYTFDATLAGDGTTTIATTKVALIWQSRASLVQYLTFDGGKVSFYIGASDDDDSRIKDGNALIGAYDASGALVWSWHVWAADYDPEAEGGTVAFGNYRMMSRNLGARAESDASAADILASYGLYYQWGRKDPFIGPAAYDAAGSISATIYNSGGKSVSVQVAASSAEVGTMAYATAHPLTFITAEKDADWLDASAADGTVRWSADEKTLYDPCPYGWRVAPAAAYEGLTIADDLAGDNETLAELYRTKFSWTLTDAATTARSLFFGAGRRSYRDASLQNYYDESLPSRVVVPEMQPWVGYYWTADAGSAFCFWFRVDDVAESGVRNGRVMGRANGMQVRCVAVE